MSACNFSIPFSGSSEQILARAKNSVQQQGGNFTGDTTNGQFDLSVYGNSIAGTYTVNGQQLNIIIDEKPFMVPCSMIESFLSKRLNPA